MALLGLLVTFAPAQAQSSAYATVSGTVRDASGRPVTQATVTLSSAGGDVSLQTATGGAGSFTLALIRPGSYELRVEALGYRPLLARPLSLAGGDVRALSLTLTIEPPPVLTVDTLVLAASSAHRWGAGTMRLGPVAIDALPHRTSDLASVTAMSTAFDEMLGAQGLTTGETVVLADGIPFYRAPHPSIRAEDSPMPLFAAGLVGSVTPGTSSADIEWPGAAGGYVSVGTRSSTNGTEVEGAYSGDVAWFSDELDIDAPSLLSYEGSARGTVPVRDDGSQLLLAADVLSHETPRPPRVQATGSLATLGASSLAPELLAGLSEPAVERYSRYAGLARLDLNSGESSRVVFRGAGSYTRRAFEGAGPLPWHPDPAVAEESVDVSLAGGYVGEITPNTTMEFRGGFSTSQRDFKGPFDGLTPAWLIPTGSEAAAMLGSPSYAAGESGRTDFILTPIFRYQPRLSALKGGLSLRMSGHTMERGAPDLSGRVYTDASGLLAGEGYGERVSAPEASFGTQEIGAFVQYDAPLGDALRVRLGARYDYERVGSDRPTLNQDWQAATGLANDAYPGGLSQVGLGGALSWDPIPSGRTRVTLAASLRDGDLDPRVIFEALSYATDATSVAYLGDGLSWPYGSIPGADLPTLALLGPDTRAPRTTSLSAGFEQGLTPSATLYAEGSLRRTDFLMRRRNLNLPTAPRFTDSDGRPVYATLEKQGALVAATGDDVRRFADFGDVWALDPDGWSEYRGLTVGLELGGVAASFFGSYTYSETTDNRVGAADGAIDASLRPGLPAATGGEDAWDEGVSDFDVPHRVALGGTFQMGVAEISASYRYRSGYPFTPGYRVGVDANGDGSIRNDVAYVPSADDLGSLLDDWTCLESQVDGFAGRNSCRAPDEHAVGAGVRVRLGDIGRWTATLTLDGLNLLEPTGGIVDDALLLVDPSGDIDTSGGTVTLPVTANQEFGSVLYPSSRGRMLRIGLRMGG